MYIDKRKTDTKWNTKTQIFELDPEDSSNCVMSCLTPGSKPYPKQASKYVIGYLYSNNLKNILFYFSTSGCAPIIYELNTRKDMYGRVENNLKSSLNLCQASLEWRT